MLEECQIPYRYRDYRKEPLSESELRALFSELGMRPHELLRRRDRAYRELDLTGGEDDALLIVHMAAHPTLLERPIARLDGKAVVGRPPERLLEIGGKP